MPVDAHHPDYRDHIADWEKCRDTVSGERAVKTAGRRYLPQLEGQTATDYEAYKQRACFFGASERTVKGCTGAIMRKAPAVAVPPALQDDWMPTAGIGDESFDMVTKAILDEVLTTGRCGILVDAANDGGDDNPPYIAVYYAENIVNWRTAMLGGEQTLTLVVLREPFIAEGLSGPDAATPSVTSVAAGGAAGNVDETVDEFTAQRKTRYRVLRLEGAGTDNPVYTQQVYREQTTTERGQAVTRWVPEVDPVTPTMRGGKKWDRIPFVFASPQNTSASIDKSPILDLVEINLSHYLTSADLEHGRHFTALPMAFAAGFDIKGDVIKVGSAVVLISGDPAAHCGYMEFSGAGLQSLERALDEKEKKMAQLGGRLLEAAPTQAETFGAVQLRQSGEHSVLVSLAISVSESLTKVLKWAAEWLGLSDVDLIKHELSQEFDNLPMDPQRLTALMQAYLAGKISFETWFYNLQRGDIYPDGWTLEDEKDAIESEGPTPPGTEVGGRALPPGTGEVGTGASGNQGEESNPRMGTGGNGRGEGRVPPARPVPARADRAGGDVVTGV